MADGTTKPIETIKIGDKVMSRNEKTGKTEPKAVSDTIKHYGVPTITLTFSDGEKVVTTAPHPFYVKDKGFIPASQLAVGKAIITHAGPIVKITKIERTAPETVYNLTVDGDHTYFVGSKDGGVWVHNAELCDEALKSIRSLEKQIAEHEEKLANYKANPDAYDNLGFLKNAPTDVIRQKIIDSRVRHLEIQTFKDNINKITGG